MLHLNHRIKTNNTLNLILIAFLFSGLISCNQTKSNSTETGHSKFFGKIFEMGQKSLLEDNCEFYFACDCCRSELIFDTDSTFYYLGFCMADQTLIKGNYVLGTNQVHLTYGSRHVSKLYNYEREFDSTAIPFFIKDSVFKPATISFDIDSCDNKIRLSDHRYGDIALETKENILEVLEDLKKDSLLNHFEMK